jgi:hypothetical protein
MQTQINLRSPFYVKVKQDGLTSVRLDLHVYTGDFVSNASVPDSTKRYQITKEPIGTNNFVVFEVSELIRDYLEIEFDGQYVGQNVWVNIIYAAVGGSGGGIEPDNTNGYCGFDGYGYFEEGANPIINDAALISNNVILKLDDSPVVIPVNTSIVYSVAFVLNGEVVKSFSLSQNDKSAEQIKYATNGYSYADSFQGRVILAGGLFEDNICLQGFEDEFTLMDCDSVHISYTENGVNKVKIIDIKNVQECKYDPIKVTFINKFGALQDIMFFKKSIEKTEVKGEEFKSSVFDLDTLSYKTYQHQQTQFMVQGNDSYTMNTGYMPEDYNEVIEQLMLSEQVWGTFTTETEVLVRPLVVKTKSLTHKTSLNDNLVEYTIEFDIANNKINNIR